MTFRPGQSGNPKGRPRGSRNKITLTKLRLDAELADGAVAVLRQVIKQAKQGCLQSQRLIIERIIPVARPSGTGRNAPHVHVELNTISGPQPPRLVLDAADPEAVPPPEADGGD